MWWWCFLPFLSTTFNLLCHIHILLTYYILKIFPDALVALVLTFNIYLSILYADIQNILFCHLF